VVTTEDLGLDQQQIAVSMAVDMEIARRAAVFIGNGVSLMPFVICRVLTTPTVVVISHEQYRSSADGSGEGSSEYPILIMTSYSA
jgi:hypothetical protein